VRKKFLFFFIIDLLHYFFPFSTPFILRIRQLAEKEDFSLFILILISKMAEILISASKFAYSKTLFTFATDLRGY